MSGREVDVDGLFERDADSRLLDRRRKDELGLAPHAPPDSASRSTFGAESMVEEEHAGERPAALRITAEARPAQELIPGAVVTVVVALHDDGDAPIPDARLRIAVPPEAEALPGSFARDDVAIDGDALLGEGLRLGAIAHGAPVRIRFGLRILPGTQTLDIGVHAVATGAPSVAAPALRLTRRSGHAAYETPKPFYELEVDEHELDDDLAKLAAVPDVERAVDTVVDDVLPLPAPAGEPEPVVAVPAPEPVAVVPEPEPVAVTPEPEPVTVTPEPEPVAVVPEPEPVAVTPEPEPVAVTPEPEPVIVTPEPVAAPPPPERYVVLSCAMSTADVRALDRVFAGGVPHGLAAVAMLAGIACTGGAAADALGLEPFRSAVAAALPRALVAARMKKAPPPIVAREALDALRPTAPLAPAAFAPDGPTLVAQFDERDALALVAVLSRDLADPFLRGVQVLLAIAPRTLAGGTQDAARRVAESLAAYRAACGAWLMRVTVRRAVDKRYDPLSADDAVLHETGRALAAALREVLGS